MDRDINELRLRYLYEAVHCGSVRAAADRLDKDASVLSRQIARLEADLAVTLIERHGRGVRPTEAGAILIDYFRQRLAHEDDVRIKLNEIRGLQRGHIDVVLGEGFVSDLFAQPLQEFWRRHPGLTVGLDVAGTNEVMRAVAEDRAHIGLVYNPPPDPRIRVHVASRQPIAAIVPPGHPLAAGPGPLTFKACLGFPVALLQGAFGIRQVLHLAEFRDKVRFAPALTTNSFSALKHFVRAGLGITFLPAFVVSLETAAGSMMALTIDDPLLRNADACLITRLGRHLPTAAGRLLSHLQVAMRAFGAHGGRSPP